MDTQNQTVGTDNQNPQVPPVQNPEEEKKEEGVVSPEAPASETSVEGQETQQQQTQ